MPMLSKETHEKFAAELARGVSQGQAYINVYGRENKSYASKLAKQPPIIDRVRELREMAQGITPSSDKRPTRRSVSDLDPDGPDDAVVDTPLANAQHEKFARYLAQDLPAAQAYTQAGYQSNPKAAETMSQSPLIADRVAVLKIVIAREANKALENPYAEQAFSSLEEMGVTKEYIATRYKRIAEKAEDVGALNHAITALDRLDKMRELEERGKSGQGSQEDDGFRLSDATAFMREMRLQQELGAKLAQEAPAPPRDVTPLVPEEDALPRRNNGNPFPLLTPPDEDI